MKVSGAGILMIAVNHHNPGSRGGEILTTNMDLLPLRFTGVNSLIKEKIENNGGR